MAALNLVTGYQGVNHVTAPQWADLNRGIIGDAAILPVGSEMQPTIQTANQITVPDGVVVYDGREFYIGYGESVNLAIASGTQGMLRNDIVVVEYNRDESSGVESAQFQVIEGTPAASNPQDPAYSDQDIRTGVFTSQKPFCRVVINGTAIQEIQMLVEVSENIEKLMQYISNLEEENTALNSALTALHPIGFSLAESAGSYYIHVGKAVIGFVNAKSTSAVTTMVINDMPEPQNDGYIIEALNSYNGEKYSITYETDHWSLRADSRQIAVDEWLRFPIVYLSK